MSQQPSAAQQVQTLYFILMCTNQYFQEAYLNNLRNEVNQQLMQELVQRITDTCFKVSLHFLFRCISYKAILLEMHRETW